MKAAICLALALFGSIGVADTATARGPSSGPALLEQNGFSEVELKAHGGHARSHHTVVVQLSHPQSPPHPTNPDGTPGRHAIPYEFPHTRVHRFCMHDADGRRHRMVLTDAAGDHVLSVTAGEECVTTTIEAGQYTATLHHDGSGTPSDVNTVFIRPHFEPVDASVLSSLTGTGPTPSASAGPIIRAADADAAQCYSSKPDFVCCNYVDTWALQGSNGLYVTVNNMWTSHCGAGSGPGFYGCPGPGPFLGTVRSVGPQGEIRGATVPGKSELFEVFTCTLNGGTGPQFEPRTIFLRAPSIDWTPWGGHSTGGFVWTQTSDEWGGTYDGSLLPGFGNDSAMSDVVFTYGVYCAQPLHLFHFADGRISLSSTLEERHWCAGGPSSSPLLYPIIENAQNFLTSYDGGSSRPVLYLQDTSFFTANRDSTILIVLGECSGCKLDGVNLAGHNLAGVNLSGAHLQNATLSFAYMPDANLAGADLTGAHLNNVDFYQVAKRPSLNGATLYQTKFANANLIGIDLSNAHLEGADFSGAQMLGALLTGITHVTGPANGQVSFVKALLAGANFFNSTFDGGDFTNAIFSTKSGSVDLLVRNSPTTTVTQPYGFVATVRPLSTTKATVCPDTTSGPCSTAAQWVAQSPPIYQGYNDPDDW